MRKSLLLAGAALSLAGAASLLHAQLEGSDRGIPPLDSTSNLEIGGIEVDVTGANANAARQEGWREAQRLGWRRLWSRTTGRPENQAPGIGDGVLNQIVSGIVVEEEQIGPTRYVARLGLLFDRARTGGMLGVAGVTRRSAPMLVIPVMRTGSTAYALEFRSPWQRAWAEFRTSGSPLDYVRPVGTGVDPLLLNAAQTGRRSRGWWRSLLDQYGAADVVVPEVQLHRLAPGGPAIARFTARYGPDGRPLGQFELTAADPSQMSAMMAEGVRRLDALYTEAFQAGLLAPDPTLITPAEFLPPPPPPPPPIVEEVEGIEERPNTPRRRRVVREDPPAADDDGIVPDAPIELPPPPPPPPPDPEPPTAARP